MRSYLFFEVMTSHAEEGKILDNANVQISIDDIYMSAEKLYSATKSIIDDVLIWSNNIALILIYF